MSKFEQRAAALAAYHAAHSTEAPNWQSIAKMLAECIPAPRGTNPAATDGCPPIADYPISGRYRTDRVGPTCVVTFSDGEVTRMSTATLPNRPLNVGRGLRLCVAAYEARQRRTERNSIVPPIAGCRFERNGEIVAHFNPADCNRHLGLG